MSKVVTVKNYAVAEGPSYICQTYVNYKAVLSKKNIKKETYCETFLYFSVAGAITVYSNVKNTIQRIRTRNQYFPPHPTSLLNIKNTRTIFHRQIR